MYLGGHATGWAEAKDAHTNIQALQLTLRVISEDVLGTFPLK